MLFFAVKRGIILGRRNQTGEAIFIKWETYRKH